MFKFIGILLLFAIGVLATAFFMGNNKPVPLDLFFANWEAVPLGLIGLAAFGLGGAFGLLAGSGVWFRLKRQARASRKEAAKADKKFAEAETELNALRANIDSDTSAT